MKICDITQSYTPQSGGIRTYILEKRRYLAAKTDHQHVLIVPGQKDSVCREGAAITYTIKAPMIPQCAPYRFILNLSKVTKILNSEQPDILELGSAYLLPFSTFSFRKRYACRIFGFYHTDYPTAYARPAMGKLFGRRIGTLWESWAAWYVKKIYNRFDTTITASPELQKKLRLWGVETSRFIPLGVDTQIFHPSQAGSKVRRELGIKSDQLVFIYSGRLDVEKRVDILLGAFNRVASSLNAALILIGNGPYRDAALGQANQNPRIKLLPYQQQREGLARLLASADLYVTAGPSETFGLSVIEAQACGLAVIGVRAGALIERVPREFGYLAEPDSQESLAEAMKNIARGNFSKMGQAARKHVEENFSWKHTFDQLLALYASPSGNNAGKQKSH